LIVALVPHSEDQKVSSEIPVLMAASPLAPRDR